MVHSARSPAEAVPRPRPDGVPGYSQDPVHPGDTFTYDFVVPDAGIYWYHPHVMSAAQVGFGLYGAFLVEDPTEMVGIADDIVLVLSDIDVTDDGEPVRPLEWKDTVDIPHERTVRLAVRFVDRPGTWIFQRGRGTVAGDRQSVVDQRFGNAGTRGPGGSGSVRDRRRNRPARRERCGMTPRYRIGAACSARGAADVALKRPFHEVVHARDEQDREDGHDERRRDAPVEVLHEMTTSAARPRRPRHRRLPLPPG